MKRAAVRLIIRGRVQGVGYRWWARREARALGLTGWVRNRADGSVEVLAIGPPAAIETFVAACRRGPPAAAVTSLDRAGAEDDGNEDFEAEPTA